MDGFMPHCLPDQARLTLGFQKLNNTVDDKWVQPLSDSITMCRVDPVFSGKRFLDTPITGAWIQRLLIISESYPMLYGYAEQLF
jgi:hypothetical protein